MAAVAVILDFEAIIGIISTVTHSLKTASKTSSIELVLPPQQMPLSLWGVGNLKYSFNKGVGSKEVNCDQALPSQPVGPRC